MPRSSKQKQKILYIARYLLENTDEEHVVTTQQIIDHLAANGIPAERKSVYNDIDTLLDFGMDIVKQAPPSGGYQVVGRDFELAEVKLLVDLVQSSKFITTRKSRELIVKLERQVSRNDGRKLQRQVVVADRNKTSNEHIYYNVDVIYEAIAQNVQVRYQYFEWDENKRQRLRRNGEFYQVSPWLLTWDDENYYLVGYDGEAEMMKHYRVDKMLKISLARQSRQGAEIFDKMDVAAFARKTFGMFAGEEKTVQLSCDKGLTGVIVDRFGSDVALRKQDDEHILVRVNVAVSPQFFGWLAGLGDKVKILSPDSVAEDYYHYLRRIICNYTKQDCVETHRLNENGGGIMNLPKDPVMLLSVVNTQLRDHYVSLTELAKAYMVEEQELVEKLAQINYFYDKEQNQFV